MLNRFHRSARTGGRAGRRRESLRSPFPLEMPFGRWHWDCCAGVGGGVPWASRRRLLSRDSQSSANCLGHLRDFRQRFQRQFILASPVSCQCCPLLVNGRVPGSGAKGRLKPCIDLQLRSPFRRVPENVPVLSKMKKTAVP